MTDPTPTRAEVARITTGLSDDNPFTRQWCRHEAADAFAVLAAENQALRERAEAARRRGDILAEGWQIADEGRIEAEAALTAARRAEAAAWNDAIEAAAEKVESLWAFRTCREVADRIRALRRAAPTGGEA